MSQCPLPFPVDAALTASHMSATRYPFSSRTGRHWWWSPGRRADSLHKERFSLPPRSLEALHNTTTTTQVPWHSLCSLPCSADRMTELLALQSCSSVLTVNAKHMQDLILHICKSKTRKCFSASVSGQSTVILEQLPWGQHFHAQCRIQQHVLMGVSLHSYVSFPHQFSVNWDRSL